jgi:hypothetical protein
MRPQIAEFGAITPRAYADQAQSQRGGCIHGHHKSTTHSRQKQNLKKNRSTEVGHQRDILLQIMQEGKRTSEEKHMARRRRGATSTPPKTARTAVAEPTKDTTERIDLLLQPKKVGRKIPGQNKPRKMRKI